ncbi:MAG: hypothetical protein NTV97_24940 [Alphaproteobacteria bacterium]|nr:hypothetical protein [Alphaproteobacteria bacterium]
MAQHKHGNMKGPNGGPMQDVADVHAKLVTTGNTVTINVYDEANKPTSARGFTGSALIVSGGDRETVALAPSGDHATKGEAKKTIAAGAAITIVLRNASGKSGQVKY